MQPALARAFYGNSTGHPRTDYRSPESHFAFERLRPQIQAAVKPGCRLLDLGCNAGRFCFFSETLGAIPVGIDCTIQALHFASEIKADLHQSQSCFVGSILPNLPFQNHTFDLALFPDNITLFSIESMRQLTRNLHRVLKPGGLFCLSLHDSLEKVMKHPNWMETYDPFTGTVETYNEIPGKGRFKNVYYVWTLPIIKHVLSSGFHLLKEEQIQDNRYWLVAESLT